MKFMPHDYQSYAIDYIERNSISAVLLDMGLGKTVITLTALNDLLEGIAPAIESIDIPGADLSQFSDIVAQLKQSNSGVNLEGSYEQTDSGMSASAAVIPVMNGEAGEAALNLDFNMDDSGLMVQIDVPGQFSGYFGAEPVDESKVKVSLGGEAQGMGLDLTGFAAYGETDAELVLLDEAGAIDVATALDGSDQTLMMELMGAVAGAYGYFTGALGAAA